MNDETRALVTVVDDVCNKITDAGAPTPGQWAAPAWDALQDLGVTTISVPEESGGSGGSMVDAVAVLQVLGEHSIDLPVADTALLGGWLLARCNATVPRGPLAAAVPAEPLGIAISGAGVAVHGSVRRVPWARHAERVIVLSDVLVLELEADEIDIVPHTNLAGEPRDDLSIDVRIPAERVHELDDDPTVVLRELRERSALARAALMAGAGRRALSLAVDYAREREQFGRPIAKFQAIQQHIAAMAGEALAVKVAVEAAALAFDAGGDRELAVAAAKATAGGSAGLVASSAHQVLGAIGYTAEHELHRSTTRLWAWRDESGTEHEWAAAVGQRVLSAGSSGLWPMLTRAR